MATIVTRSGKGSPLTNNELDANFTNLNTDKIESGNTVAALTITDLVVSNALTVDTNTLKVDNSNNRVGILDATPAVSLDVGSATDAVHVPTGTTAQRPTGAAGMFRYNSTENQFEGYSEGAWDQIGGGGATIEVDNFTGNGSTTAFTMGADPLTENNTAVYIDGVYQQKNTYTQSGTTLTFSTAPPNGATIEVNRISASAVTVGTPDDNTVSTVKIQNLAVTTDKLANSTGASDGVTTGKIATSAVTDSKLATNSVTTVKITDANVTLAKLAAAVQARLRPELDSATAKTAAFNAVAGKKYYVDTTSSAITATLPASPSVGDNIQFVDFAGTFATNNLTLGRNGKKVLRLAADGVVDQDNFAMIWEFTGDTHGWLPIV
tara:strand:- start:699 stop:1835 length:1137 start_codon:yes stop_codon:yes gene_type:complete